MIVDRRAIMEIDSANAAHGVRGGKQGVGMRSEARRGRIFALTQRERMF